MSIQVYVKDPLLARMLFLEAKRQGFREDSEPSVLFVDLDHCKIPASADRLPTVGVTASPDQISPGIKKKVSALLSLPFSVRNLEVILHRFGEKQENTVTREGKLLYLNGQKICLSATEAKLFDLLFDNRHRLVTEQEMVALLGESATRTNTLAVYLYRLRRKLTNGGAPCIRTVRGKGCQWVESR